MALVINEVFFMLGDDWCIQEDRVAMEAAMAVILAHF